MKTKKESNASLGKLSEPWRNSKKGELSEVKRKSDDQPKFRIAGYVRLSPTGDEREEGSLVSHPQRIKQFVESKNVQAGGSWGEIVDWYVDKDLSGKDMNRPAFQKMLKDIKAGIVNAVIVTELSRLNRKVRDFCEVHEFFKEHKTALFSLKENFDTSTPMGELMLIQAMSFAQFERQTIVDRVKRGSRARAERGLANGILPLGFKLVDHRPNYRAIDETERSYVELIFNKFLELKRINKLITFLNENGYRTKEITTKSGKKIGGHRWSMSSIHSLLTNRVYIGEREVNKRFRTQNQDELREDERYFCVKAHWPEIVLKEIFFDVQRMLEQNKKKARKYVHDYRLTGLIECAECGQKLIGKSGSGRTGKYFYYGHKRKMLSEGDRHLQRCKIENVPAPILEEAIVSRMKDLSGDRKIVAELVRLTSSKSQTSTDLQKSLIAAKEQERRKLEQKIENLLEAISEENDRELRLSLSNMTKDLKTQLDQVIAATLSLKQDYEHSCKVVDITEALKLIQIFKTGAFDALPVSTQAEILKERIRRIVVQEKGLYVEFFGQKLEYISRILKGDGEKNELNAVRSTPSGVLPVFKLVQST